MNDDEYYAWQMKWLNLEIRVFTAVMLTAPVMLEFLVASWLDWIPDSGATQVLSIAAMTLACAAWVGWKLRSAPDPKVHPPGSNPLVVPLAVGALFALGSVLGEGMGGDRTGMQTWVGPRVFLPIAGAFAGSIVGVLAVARGGGQGRATIAAGNVGVRSRPPGAVAG